MSLVTFTNNSAPYINADNLNNNFNELDTKINNKHTITNYANQITPNIDAYFYNNSQQLIKNSDGLVIINLTFKANSNINMTNNVTLFSLPSDLRPTKNILFLIYSSTQNVIGMGYYQIASGNMVGKLGTTLNANSELQIVGSYYII